MMVLLNTNSAEVLGAWTSAVQLIVVLLKVWLIFSKNKNRSSHMIEHLNNSHTAEVQTLIQANVNADIPDSVVFIL